MSALTGHLRILGCEKDEAWVEGDLPNLVEVYAREVLNSEIEISAKEEICFPVRVLISEMDEIQTCW